MLRTADLLKETIKPIYISLLRILNRLIFLLDASKRRRKNKGKLITFGSGLTQVNIVYVINLNRQLNRWKKIKVEFQNLTINNNNSLISICKRVPAVDARVIDLDTLDGKYLRRSYELASHYYVEPDPRLLSLIKEKDQVLNLTKEEIAVALSHINCWKKIVEKGDEFALVLEDDIYFDATFVSKMNAIWSTLREEKIDILYLSYMKMKYGPFYDIYKDDVIVPHKGFLWLSGYILSKTGAQKLLDRLPITGPVDVWLNHQFTDLNVYASSTSIINQRKDLRSDNSYSISPVYRSLNRNNSQKSNKYQLDEDGHNR